MATKKTVNAQAGKQAKATAGEAPATGSAANRAALVIDDKTYTLTCDFNTLADHEPATGCNLLHAVPAIMLNVLSASQLRGMLYASLKTHHPGIDLLRAGQLVRVDTMPLIYKAIGQTELVRNFVVEEK